MQCTNICPTSLESITQENSLAENEHATYQGFQTSTTAIMSQLGVLGQQVPHYYSLAYPTSHPLPFVEVGAEGDSSHRQQQFAMVRRGAAVIANAIPPPPFIMFLGDNLYDNGLGAATRGPTVATTNIKRRT